MEWLDIVDENGEPTGELVSRAKAHAEGIPHRTSHVWVVRVRDGVLEVLLQKRSDNKDSFPGCYDISSAGHIPAGEDYVTSALRELKEEIGVAASPEELVLCGQRRFEFERTFRGRQFHDNQVTNIYLLWLDRDEDEFVLQKEEVSAVRWMGFDACIEAARENTIKHCLYEEELLMVREAARRSAQSRA